MFTSGVSAVFVGLFARAVRYDTVYSEVARSIAGGAVFYFLDRFRAVSRLGIPGVVLFMFVCRLPRAVATRDAGRGP